MRLLVLGALVLLACGAAPAAAILEVPELPPLQSPPADDTISTLGVAAPELDGTIPNAPGAPQPAPPRAPLAPPAVAAAATAGGVALVLAGFALYSRLARSDLLDHERRDAILKLVEREPGIPLTEIAQRSGLAWGTAVYHLERLERAGFLVSERNAGRRCYFRTASVPRDDRMGLGTLQQETTRSVAEFVAARPGATQTELCEGLGLSASAASKQVSKLESAGLVRREREWKTVRLHPAENLATLLAPVAA